MSIDVSAVTGCRVRSRRPTVTPTKPDFGVGCLAFLHAAILQSSFYYSTRSITVTDAVAASGNGPRYFSTRASRKIVNDREWMWRSGIYFWKDWRWSDIRRAVSYHRDRTLYLSKIIWYLAWNYVKCIRCIRRENHIGERSYPRIFYHIYVSLDSAYNISF